MGRNDCERCWNYPCDPGCGETGPKREVEMTRTEWETYAHKLEKLALAGDRAAVRELVKAFEILWQAGNNMLDTYLDQDESFVTRMTCVEEFADALLGCFGEVDG